MYIVCIDPLLVNVKNKAFIKFIGYLDKNNSEEYKKYIYLYQECNAFILPTRAECAGLVFAEANAFGMPIFATKTATYVRNGENGYTLLVSAQGIDFGKCIEKVYRNRQFELLSNGSINTYLNYTSWKAWSKHFKSFIERDFFNNDDK